MKHQIARRLPEWAFLAVILALALATGCCPKQQIKNSVDDAMREKEEANTQRMKLEISKGFTNVVELLKKTQAEVASARALGEKERELLKTQIARWSTRAEKAEKAVEERNALHKERDDLIERTNTLFRENLTLTQTNNSLSQQLATATNALAGMNAREDQLRKDELGLRKDRTEHELALEKFHAQKKALKVREDELAEDESEMAKRKKRIRERDTELAQRPPPVNPPEKSAPKGGKK